MDGGNAQDGNYTKFVCNEHHMDVTRKEEISRMDGSLAAFTFPLLELLFGQIRRLKSE
jgi:hypothetical protein